MLILGHLQNLPLLLHMQLLIFVVSSILGFNLFFFFLIFLEKLLLAFQFYTCTHFRVFSICSLNEVDFSISMSLYMPPDFLDRWCLDGRSKLEIGVSLPYHRSSIG